MANTVFSKAAEHVMRRWVMSKSILERLQEPIDKSGQTLSQDGPYVVISRQAGLEASRIAHDVASQLGWEAFDHELLERVAEQYHSPVQLMEVLDEQPAYWLSEILDRGIAHREWAAQTFVHRVAKVLQLAGHNGNCVIVGRGAQYILPRDNGVFVRLTAPIDYRAEITAARENVTLRTAKSMVSKLDQKRKNFVKQYFHCDVAAPEQYDLVVNVGRFGPIKTAKLIVESVQMLGEGRAERTGRNADMLQPTPPVLHSY